MEGEQQEFMKVIQFPKEHIEERKIKEAKDIAKMLIDECDGDFSVVFKSEDVQHLFKDDAEKEFLVATTDIRFLDKILISKGHAYFKLKED